MLRRFSPVLLALAAVLLLTTLLNRFSTVVASSNPELNQVTPTVGVFLPLVNDGKPAPSPTATQQPVGDKCAIDPDPALAPNRPLQIVLLNKGAQAVDLRNFTSQTIILDGWYICSINGNERAIITPGLAAPPSGAVGVVHLGEPIWSTTTRDDVALYDPDGNLISYYVDQN